MLVAIAAVLALTVLEGWVRFAVIGLAAVIDVAQIVVWLRWRKVRSIAGAEGIVGERGRALTDFAPEGQVSVKGQIWTATASEEVRAGDEVTVTEVDGLRLTVRRGAEWPTAAATRVDARP